MVRQPAVAGQFYPGNAERLAKDLSHYIGNPPDTRQRVLGIMVPHAGYVYSGAVAGAVYGNIEIPRIAIILCPNHHGIGAVAALSPAAGWQTPLGTVPVATDLSRQILAAAPELIAFDALAHLYEHSLEVQLPFLQTLRPDVKIVPLSIGFGDYERCRRVGEALAQVVASSGESILIVASSDMTHYESAAEAKQKDSLAIERICDLDPVGLLSTCRSHGITMCGVVPATIMLIAAKLLGASSAVLTRYATSGDVTGDFRQVVAYAGLTVS